MTLRNQAELKTLINNNFPDNSIGSILPANGRVVAVAQCEAAVVTTAVISGGATTQVLGAVDTFEKLATFSANNSANNEIFNPDQANNEIRVIENCVVQFNCELNGEWTNNNDLTMQIRINGVAPFTSIPVVATGRGTGKKSTLRADGILVISGTAPLTQDVEVWVKGESAFTITQDSLTFVLSYIQYSIREN